MLYSFSVAFDTFLFSRWVFYYIRLYILRCCTYVYINFNLNNIFHAFQCFLTFVVYVTADIGLTAGQNQYLPPNKGYNYDRPSIPFGSAPAPQTVK